MPDAAACPEPTQPVASPDSPAADTGELVDLMHSAKGAWKLLDLLGRIAKPVGALVAAGVGLWASLKGAGWNGGWGGK